MRNFIANFAPAYIIIRWKERKYKQDIKYFYYGKESIIDDSRWMGNR